MRRIGLLVAVLSLIAHPTVFAVTPSEMIEAVDQMTPEQAYDFMRALEAKTWEPIPKGFFDRMAAQMAFTFGALDTVDLEGVNLSAGERDVETVSGYDFGLTWWLIDPRFRLGLKMGGSVAVDSELDANGYSRVELQDGYGTIVASYELVREDNWLLWAELGLGSGGIRIDTVDTPAGQPTTQRILDGSYSMADARLGAAWRFNSVLSLFASGGYRFADEIEFDEGGEETTAVYDASGPSGQIGLNVDF